MIIERKVIDYVLLAEESISRALEKISANKLGIVFLISQDGVLFGSLTDGDVRRWMLKSKHLDLSLPASIAAKKDPVVAGIHQPTDEIAHMLSERIKVVPVLDSHQRIVGVALRRAAELRIASAVVSNDHPAFVIAEIGNNHNGSLDLAFQLIDEAAKAGADCAKFQMRHLESMHQSSAGDIGSDLGDEYTMDLLRRFQLSTEQMIQCFDYTKSKGLIPLCTPWDAESVAVLEAYGMPAYKIASADLTNPELLERVCKTGKPLICSTGMSKESEIISAVGVLRRHGNPFVLLHCNSTYPAPFKDIHLNYMERLRELSDGGLVGYSGHERGAAVALAAVARGAKVIEKHFTLDRNMEGNDHRVSLLPCEFAGMVKSIREIEQAMGSGLRREITQGEMMNREVLGKSVVARVAIKAGDVISEAHLAIKSPGKGLVAYRKKDLIGRKAKRNLAPGEFFFESDLKDGVVRARQYRFGHAFGVPVRYHDVDTMAARTRLDLLEFHLSYKDMELNPADFLKPTGYDLDLVVHSPELFAGDHIMDLCSDDPAYRARSMNELQRVINLTRSIKPYFHKCVRPRIVINAGGFTMNEFLPVQARQSKYQLVAAALSELDTTGVEIMPQTMPPFPWHFGGQRFHNLFMDPIEIAEFCEKENIRICLDVSHSKLFTVHSGLSFQRFVEQVAPYVSHLHLADARGTDGEGLQIGDGEIDFVALGDQLKRLCPQASFIPETWQGHKNEGEGFWVALNRLSDAFGQARSAGAAARDRQGVCF